MRIDQTGNHRAVGGVDGFVRLEISGQARRDAENMIVLDEDVMVFELFDTLLRTPADDVAIFDEELHELALFLSGGSGTRQRNSLDGFVGFNSTRQVRSFYNPPDGMAPVANQTQRRRV
jgi:hypothetical protein